MGRSRMWFARSRSMPIGKTRKSRRRGAEQASRRIFTSISRIPSLMQERLSHAAQIPASVVAKSVSYCPEFPQPGKCNDRICKDRDFDHANRSFILYQLGHLSYLRDPSLPKMAASTTTGGLLCQRERFSRLWRCWAFSSSPGAEEEVQRRQLPARLSGARHHQFQRDSRPRLYPRRKSIFRGPLPPTTWA